MKALTIIIFSIVWVVLLTVVIWYFAGYREYKTGCVGKIKFKQYLLFREIAPGSWYEYDGFVTYGGEDRGYALYFSPIDTIRYQYYRKHAIRKRNLESKNKCYAKVLEDIQKDIEKYRKENAKIHN